MRHIVDKGKMASQHVSALTHVNSGHAVIILELRIGQPYPLTQGYEE